MGLSDIFSKQCKELKVATMNAHESFGQELAKRQDQVQTEVNNQEVSLRLALRDEVVGDVMKVFPCVFVHVFLSTVC